MTGDRKIGGELLPHIDILRAKEGVQVADAVLMAIEFMRHQGEVAYEVGKRQALSIASTASTVGIGWSAFFFGIAIDSWFMSGVGLVLVLGGTFILGYFTPRMLDKLRTSLTDSGAAKLYAKWISGAAKPSDPGKSQ